MLEFMRNKLVSVSRKDPDTLVVQAVLDDSIYGLEIDLEVGLDDLICRNIEGRWKRWTTPDCPRALDFLRQAKGMCLKHGVEDEIHKIIGRTSCRHYANLLIECVYALHETRYIILKEQADKAVPPVKKKEIRTVPPDKASHGDGCKKMRDVSATCSSESVRVLKDGEFVLDLHMHTFPASKCASASVDDMIREAKRIGLSAACITDHNYVWSPDEIEKLMDKHQFLIFAGNEIVTDQGDVLVFGFNEDIQGVIKLSELKKRVDDAGGFISAAHPFRGFLTFGTGEIGLTAEKGMERDMFRHVHAVETLNGKVTDSENRLAGDVARGLHLPGTGGSDAHDISTIGVYATLFKTPVKNTSDLVEKLKSGTYESIAFRK